MLNRVISHNNCTTAAITYINCCSAFLSVGKNEQIDRISKLFVKLSAREIKFAKREHKRAMRRQRKNIDKPNPQHNRYSGWIG